MGFDLYLHVRRVNEQVKNLQNEITHLGRDSVVILGDLRDIEDGLAEVMQILNHPKVQVIVHNAATFESVDFNSYNSKFLQQLKINFLPSYWLTKALSINSISSKCVINICDAKTKYPEPKHIDYLLTKNLLEYFTKASAIFLAPNVRVNAICLGAIMPPVATTDSSLKNTLKKYSIKNRVD